VNSLHLKTLLLTHPKLFRDRANDGRLLAWKISHGHISAVGNMIHFEQQRINGTQSTDYHR